MTHGRTPLAFTEDGGLGRDMNPDVVSAIVDHSHLEGEDVGGVRVLERFSFAEVPAERASEVVDKVNGQRVRGVELRGPSRARSPSRQSPAWSG